MRKGVRGQMRAKMKKGKKKVREAILRKKVQWCDSTDSGEEKRRQRVRTSRVTERSKKRKESNVRIKKTKKEEEEKRKEP